MAARNMYDIAVMFQKLKFRKRLIGGVDEKDVWKKLEQIQEQYQMVYSVMQESNQAMLRQKDDEIQRLRRQLSRVRANG